MFPNQKIEKEYIFPDINFRADYLLTDSNNKKTVIEIKTIININNESPIRCIKLTFTLVQ